MKKILALTIPLFLISCTENQNSSIKSEIENDRAQHNTIPLVKNEAAPESNAQSKLTIEGMTCEIGCVRTVKSHLSKMEGVSFIHIDFDTSRVVDFTTVQFDSNLVSQAEIQSEIESIAQGIYKVTENEIIAFNPDLKIK